LGVPALVFNLAKQQPGPVMFTKFIAAICGALLFALSAAAAPVAGVSTPINIDLQRVTLADFLRVVYGELLQQSYVLDAPVVADAESFSMSLRNIDRRNIEREARSVENNFPFFQARGSVMSSCNP
jgi:hypothetical protein